MIGKKTLELLEGIPRGMSTSDDFADGGFSPKTTGVNLTSKLGVLQAPALVTDKSANLAGNIITSATDANNTGNENYFVTDTGKFFTWDSSTLTLRQTDSVKSYTNFATDFIQYKLNAFATSTTDITLLTGSDLGTIDATWWTTTKSKSALTSNRRHEMIVYEDTLFISDGNKLHSWDGTTASESVLLLSSEQSIISMGIEPGSGYMLLGITEGDKASNSKPALSKVLVWDGFSDKPLRSIVVDDTVNAFKSVGGTTYVTYGTKFGYWNGSGITFLRTFENVTRSTTTLVFKNKITNIGNTIYTADGSRVLAYGEVVPGQKVFYPAFKNATALGCLASTGGSILGMAYATAKFDTLDVESTASISSSNFYTNKYNFGRPVYIRGAFVEYPDTGQANGVTSIRLYMIDDKQASTEFSTLINSTGSVEYFGETRDLDKKTRTVQFHALLQNSNVGVRRIVVSYDVAE